VKKAEYETGKKERERRRRKRLGLRVINVGGLFSIIWSKNNNYL
jgi:hypothetical protein